MLCIYLLFFFSSRRRHTRSKRDWSSDVCSSDLKTFFPSEVPQDPKWGVKKNSEGKNVFWFGYKAHLIVGTSSQYILDSLFSSGRSEERRVGKECRSRWSETHEKEKGIRENQIYL